MIKINISKLLGERKLTQKNLALGANIRPATVSALYHETAKVISFEQLNNICKFLDCSISDLLEYISDETI